MILIFLIFPAVIFASGYHLGEVNTRVNLTYGNQRFSFYTTEKSLNSAIADRGITLYPQDISSLPLSTKLNGGTATLSITPSTPVVINDGYTKIIGRSASNNATQILADSRVKVNPEDKISESLILDPVATGSAGILIQIDRAPSYFVAVDGQEIEVRSWNPTVGAILASSKVKINPQDEVSLDQKTALVPGEEITVTRINEVDIPTTETVAFDTENTTSASVPFGQSRVTQTGANGQIQKTYHVVYKNGVEVSRWLISSVVTIPVQDKIIARGIVTGRANFGYYSGMSTSFYLGYTGHHLLVTNLANGKQVTVTIIGGGPYDGPLMDMGTAAFQAIGGSLGSGYIPSVSVSLLD